MDRLCERAGLPGALVGSLIDDRFKIRRFLASGNFGYVYEAEHEIFGHPIRRVAFKLLKQPGLDRAKVAENFSDALAAARIAESHRGHEFVQHIVGVFDAGLCAAWDDRGYVVMEFVQRDLRGELRLHPHGRLPVRLALDYARQICRAMVLAHEMNPPVVHRDLKPPNILIGTRGEAKVSDFGLARAVGYLTRDTAGAGDLSCQAPESLDGTATPASDVYSIGLTLYEMLTGTHPFHDVARGSSTPSSDYEAVRLHRERRRQPIRPAAELNSQLVLMPDLAELVDRCVRPEPAHRFRNARDLLDALEKVGRIEPPPPPPSGPRPDCQSLLAQSLLSEQRGDLQTALLFAERALRAAESKQDRTYIGEALFRSGHLKVQLRRTDDGLADLLRAQVEFRHGEATKLRVRLVREGARA